MDYDEYVYGEIFEIYIVNILQWKCSSRLSYFVAEFVVFVLILLNCFLGVWLQIVKMTQRMETGSTSGDH